jgi:hypothetical protein
MLEFEDSLAALKTARTTFAAAESAARDAERALRRGGADAAEARKLRNQVKAAQVELQRSATELERAVADFGAFSDPQKTLSMLPDSDPLLLFPLRLESRFGQSSGGQAQLWVRVYPDSCLVDAFTERLSEAELASAKTYWTERWCAAGSDTRHRAAWRQLVASHGVGRARHVLASFAPQNAADETSLDEDQVALVIPTQAIPADDEDIRQFWKEMWHADGDPATRQAAFDALEARIGADAAKSAVDGYVPVRFGELGPAGGVRQFGTVVFLVFPEDPPTAASAWNTAPVADPLPERFVLVLDPKGGKRRTLLGEPVRTPLHVGFDPTGLVGAPPASKDAALEFSAETAWLADFDAAVRAGMAFRVDLRATEARDGFDRICVTGVSLSPDPAEGRTRLERFITHRLRSNADFALVPQGTPTNNTEEEASGFSRRADPERVFDAVTGPGLFATTADPRFRSDGQWLAEALGVDPQLIARSRLRGWGPEHRPGDAHGALARDDRVLPLGAPEPGHRPRDHRGNPRPLHCPRRRRRADTCDQHREAALRDPAGDRL